MSDQRRLWRAAAVFGVLTVATAIVFLGRTVPDCGVPLASPMLDFELATRQPQFAALLDCAPRLAELDFQNLLDLLLFMWVYTAMLTAFMLATGVRRAVALGLAALMLGGDFVETAVLRQIGAGWPQLDGSLVTLLAVAVRVKFVAIGVAMLASAARLWRRPGRGARVTSPLVAAGGIGSLAILVPGLAMLGSLLVFVGWLAIPAYAAVKAFRSRPPAPSSADA